MQLKASEGRPKPQHADLIVDPHFLLTDPGAGPKEDSATPYPPEGAQLDLIIHRLKDDFFQLQC